MADANLKVLNADGTAKYMKEHGAGSDGDPHVVVHAIESGGVASGAYAAGSIAAGAVVAGALVDGADLTQGALADAVVAAGATGSSSAKLRRLTTDLDALLTELKVKADPTESQQTKGVGFSIQADLTVDAGAYAIGDAAATLITFANAASANGKRSVINSITLAPNDAMPAIAFNLWLLNADLATGIAKNAAFVIVAADAPKILGVIPITAADYIPSQTSWNVATLRGVGQEFAAAAANTSIYGYLVCTAVTAPVATHLYVTIAGEFVD